MVPIRLPVLCSLQHGGTYQADAWSFVRYLMATASGPLSIVSPWTAPNAPNGCVRGVSPWRSRCGTGAAGFACESPGRLISAGARPFLGDKAPHRSFAEHRRDSLIVSDWFKERPSLKRHAQAPARLCVRTRPSPLRTSKGRTPCNAKEGRDQGTEMPVLTESPGQKSLENDGVNSRGVSTGNKKSCCPGPWTRACSCGPMRE